MIKSERGITLIALVITLVVMMILTFTITINVSQLNERKAKTDFENDITSLTEEVSQYYARTKTIPIINRYTNITMLTGVKNVNDNNNYYVIDIKQLDVSLNNGKDYKTALSRNRDQAISDLLDIYIINEQSHTIYYPKGANYDGSIHYTDTEIYNSIDSVTHISTPQDLVTFRNSVNAGNDYNGKYVVLNNDIDLTTVCSATLGSWAPIGTDTTHFKGTFIGNGHKISNLYINSNNYQYSGLFGFTENATIRNFTMENVYVSSTTNGNSTINEALRIGGIVGNATTTNIVNCGIESGTISGNSSRVSVNSGGIVGRAIGSSIEGCFNSAQISAVNAIDTSSSMEAKAGGIIGLEQDTSILNCYNTGDISTESDKTMSGGIVGQGRNTSNANIKITNCYNIGNLTLTGSRYVYEGGIIARNNWDSNTYTIPLENCYCTTANTYLQIYYDGTNNVNDTSNRIAPVDLKTYAGTLGEAYKTDTNNINNGYPILTWQD